MTVRAAMAMAGLAAMLPVTLSGCAAPDTIAADKAWVRLAAVTGRPAAAYFTLTGGATDATLINVSADLAIRAEMHATMTSGNMAAMKPLASVAIPARTAVPFQPGGRHVMLYDVAPSAKPATTMVLTFSFADGQRLQRKAYVVGAGDAEPEW